MYQSDGFNPRSRGGSDCLECNGLGYVKLFQSTLPWWERHQLQQYLLQYYLVSIHAPVVGATDARKKDGSTDPVSIHAPVVGATRQGFEQANAHCCFNPRSRGGSDLPLGNSMIIPWWFQSTLPWWERP